MYATIPVATFAEHVFTQMKERDILRFEGPLGTFFLREDSDKPIIFVASGTGFAPVKSILEHIFHVETCVAVSGKWCSTGEPHQGRSVYGESGGKLAGGARQFHFYPGTIGGAAGGQLERKNRAGASSRAARFR